MREKVQQLLDSEISASKIQRDTGIQKTQISKLRNHKIKLDNIAFGNAIKLYDYAEQVLDENGQPNNKTY